MPADEATQPVYPLGPPGDDLLLYEGEVTVADKTAAGRLQLSMTGGTGFHWKLDQGEWRSLPLGESRLALAHPELGALNLDVRVTSSAGSGVITSTSVGSAVELDLVVLHWVNVPDIQPAEPVRFGDKVAAARWSGAGGGWSFDLDAREDHAEVFAAAKGTPFSAVTHTGTLRRTDGAGFSPAEAEHALAGLHVALSFALGRWVAPALATGFVDGRRAWELWSAWRCDDLLPNYAWWDTHTGDDLRTFVALFLEAWLDRLRHEVVRHVAHHVIESNRSSMTMEARIMLVGAALEYLSWVTYALGGLRSKTQHKKRQASDNLRELLERAGVPTDLPAELPGLAQVQLPDDGRPQQGGPEAVAWVRNKLVHPKDASQPYRIEHLVRETWQLLMQYGELLLLREIGYAGSYCARFPLGGWAHQSKPVPWAIGGP